MTLAIERHGSEFAVEPEKCWWADDSRKWFLFSLTNGGMVAPPRNMGTDQEKEVWVL